MAGPSIINRYEMPLAVLGGHDDLADVHVDLVLGAALVDLAVTAVGCTTGGGRQRLAPGRAAAKRPVLGVQIGIAVAVVVILPGVKDEHVAVEQFLNFESVFGSEFHAASQASVNMNRSFGR